jgi:hypothetical protein
VSRKTGRSRQRRQEAADEAPPRARGRGPSTGSRRSPGVERAPARDPAPWLRTSSLVKWLVWGTAVFVFFYYTAAGIERQITWYLAVDQFGYLTFAHDLLHGRVFHDWEPLRVLGALLPKRTDILAQTYVFDYGLVYCRYSPGFPMLLAGWIGLFGDNRAHYLNPTIYIVLLALALGFQWRVFRSPWRAAAGTALIALFPTTMHLWGLTLTRDLSAHLFAFLSLFLLLPADGKPLRWPRLLAAALALGFTVSIRPDGVLYLIPFLAMLSVRWWHERRRHSSAGLALATVAMGFGILVGASPMLAYNWVATGSPFLPTQGMELPLLGKPAAHEPPAESQPKAPEPAPAQATPQADSKVGYPSPGWRGGTSATVQGGGLQIANFPKTAYGNWQLLLRAYTPLLFALAVWGGVVAVLLRPVLAAGAVSYAVIAFLFYSCWPRPDFRYLIGVLVFLPMLVVEGTMGTLDLVRLSWKRGRHDLARGIAVFAAGVLLLGAMLLQPKAQPGASLPLPVFLVVTIVAGAAAALAATRPQRRVVALAAPALMLGLIWCKVSDVQAQASRRAPFQRPQMEEARANMKKLLDPNAVVITVEEVGRPAENLEYYGGVNTLYLTDLERWHLSPGNAASFLLLDGRRPYLYIPAGQPNKAAMLDDLRIKFDVELIADIPPDRAMAHFVAAPFHRGVRMELYRLSMPALEELGRKAGIWPPPAH